MSKIGKRRIAVVLAIAIPLFMLVLALSASYIGVTSKIWSGGLPLSASDPSAVPQSVADDASRLANQLFGDGKEKYDDFVEQLLVTYLEAKDKDFVVFFNPGGWGWNLAEASPGWSSIFTGIKSELTSSGYKPLLLNYRRTADTFSGRLNEIVEMMTGYSSKSNHLAYRVEFLTSHIPDLKVIITGESNGTVICDQTMNILTDNPQVYSIQTGPPFWHDNIMLNRTLVLNGNGMVPDSFSQGDFLTMARANLRALFGLPVPEEQSGTIGHFVRAPGHDYWWHYPRVCPQITDFLDKHCGTK